MFFTFFVYDCYHDFPFPRFMKALMKVFPFRKPHGDLRKQTCLVVLYVRLTGQYFFYKTYFKPKIHKTITSN